jgi:cation:H+ antiporter
MAIAAFYMIVGLVLLAFGAEGLVRGSASIALRLGIAPLVVGLTIVAFGTGSPEFVVSIAAALSGNSGIALGNVVGSNISNVALILGVAALVRPLTVKAEVLRRELPIMIAISAFLWLLIYDGVLSRIEGAFLTASALAYTFLTYKFSKLREKRSVEAEFEEAIELTGKSTMLDVGLIIGGLALLIIGANVMLSGAVSIARGFGISEIVIGLTIVAIGTSLPELATSAVAAYKKEPDIAFGNAIGSNVLNILAVLGITAMLEPISAGGLRTLDIGAMLGSALVLFVLLGRNYKLSRIEGMVLLIGYGIYLYTFVPD